MWEKGKRVMFWMAFCTHFSFFLGVKSETKPLEIKEKSKIKDEIKHGRDTFENVPEKTKIHILISLQHY